MPARRHSVFPFSARCLLAATALLAGTPLAGIQAHAADRVPEFNLLPRPAVLMTRAGFFPLPPTLAASLTGVTPGQESLLLAAATPMGGMPPVAAAGTASLRFEHVQDGDPRPEGSYDLIVDRNGITIRATDDAGLYYGAVTLSQLRADAQGHGKLPFLVIHDQPRLRWRGLMVDSTRHFQNVEDIRHLIDAMAALKLNVLHWHLTDDQGWRLEIRRYPELTRIGAWRRAVDSGPNGDGAPYGGFYTQDQVREIVAYAAARHITIVPEIEMPGHARAAIAAYPHLGSGGTPVQVATVMGVHPYLFNVDDSTFTFLHNVLDEVMELFPSPYIHVGGDEAVKDQWRASPSIQAHMKKLGIHDEDALQSWFIGQIGTYLTTHGRRLIGWDEILEGGLPASASVMSWHGVSGALAAAKAGHDAVMAPSNTLYFDYLQTDRDDEPTGGRYPVTPLSKIYGFDPLPAGTPGIVTQHLLGIEAPTWTEYLTTGPALLRAIFPRADAIAEIAWTPKARQDWASFITRLPTTITRQQAIGLPVSDSALTPTLQAEQDMDGRFSLTLSNALHTGTIHYTLDGTSPDTTSPVWKTVLSVPEGTRLAAQTFDSTGHALGQVERDAITPLLLTSRTSGHLAACPGGRLSVRVPTTPDAASPFLSIDRENDCVLYPGASLGNAQTLGLDMVVTTHFFGTVRDARGTNAMSAPKGAAVPPGHVGVWLDRCTGTPVGMTALPQKLRPGTPFHVTVPLNGVTGTHDVCIAVPGTGKPGTPYYAFSRVTIGNGTP